MKPRVNFFEKGQGAVKALSGLGIYLAKSPLEEHLQQLIEFRVSQINGCAFCLDMHSKDLRANGEQEHRLYTLNAWRETPFFTERERAALAFAESLTALNGAVPDDIYEQADRHFTAEELVDLTIVIITINAYNRLNLAFPNPAMVGTYKPGMFK